MILPMEFLRIAHTVSFLSAPDFQGDPAPTLLRPVESSESKKRPRQQPPDCGRREVVGIDAKKKNIALACPAPEG